MMSNTKSVDEPPACRPKLAPPMLYMAGVDHFPLKFFPWRQIIGPRPPLPPITKPTFFTSGRTMTQLARARTSAGTFLLPSIACSTVAAFFRVSSSFDLSAAHTGTRIRLMSVDVRKRCTTFLVMCEYDPFGSSFVTALILYSHLAISFTIPAEIQTVAWNLAPANLVIGGQDSGGTAGNSFPRVLLGIPSRQGLCRRSLWLSLNF